MSGALPTNAPAGTAIWLDGEQKMTTLEKPFLNPHKRWVVILYGPPGQIAIERCTLRSTP